MAGLGHVKPGVSISVRPGAAGGTLRFTHATATDTMYTHGRCASYVPSKPSQLWLACADSRVDQRFFVQTFSTATTPTTSASSGASPL